MHDEHLRRQEVERGHRAREILDNPLWKEIWEGYKSTVIAHMTDKNTADEAVIEAKRLLTVVNQIQEDLEEALETGHFALTQLEEARNE